MKGKERTLLRESLAAKHAPTSCPKHLLQRSRIFIVEPLNYTKVVVKIHRYNFVGYFRVYYTFRVKNSFLCVTSFIIITTNWVRYYLLFAMRKHMGGGGANIGENIILKAVGSK